MEEEETQLDFYDAEDDLEELQQQTTFDITELSDAVKNSIRRGLDSQNRCQLSKVLQSCLSNTSLHETCITH